MEREERSRCDSEEKIDGEESWGEEGTNRGVDEGRERERLAKREMRGGERRGKTTEK
jgi:hypothetical protein